MTRDADIHNDAAATEPVTLSNVDVIEALPMTHVGKANTAVVDVDIHHQMTRVLTCLVGYVTYEWWSVKLTTMVQIIGTQTLAYASFDQCSSHSPHFVTYNQRAVVVRC